MGDEDIFARFRISDVFIPVSIHFPVLLPFGLACREKIACDEADWFLEADYQ